MMLVLLMTPLYGVAGELKIGRYIEPNRMSNLFTRHVRKGMVKRIGLSEAQLYQIRESSELRFEDFVERLAAGELLGLKDNNASRGK